MYPTINLPADAIHPQPVRHLTKKEVAERLGVPTRTIEKRVNAKTMLLPVYPCGGKQPRWHRELFEEWFDREHRGTTKPADDAAGSAQPPALADAPPAAPPAATPVPARQSAALKQSKLEPSGAVNRMKARAEKRLQQLSGRLSANPDDASGSID